MALHPKTARTDHEVLDLIERRWSPRAFDSAKDVSQAELFRLFEAARWAPSAGNEQPWRFVAASRHRSPAAFAALLLSLKTKNRLWAEAAPVLVLVAVQDPQGVERPPASRVGAWYDAGQAVGFLTLQATAMGLSIRQMEGFDAERAREACAVPPEFSPAVVMAIGYAGDPESLSSESHRSSERQPRSRRPVGDIVFDGVWDRKFS
ncbi:MAG TPA: nitroreductase family protein [Vicinamibacterales bacterium]|nr:nitroreductase family protein [Vicinamibacterales bacterium]